MLQANDEALPGIVPQFQADLRSLNGKDEATACGPNLGNSVHYTELRALTKEGLATFKIDRLD